MSLDLLLEKTHRVFRVIEINQSLADFPKFWNWLHEVKIPEQSREALCPPACQGSALVWNCTTCRRVEVRCWEMKTCYPGEGLLLCYNNNNNNNIYTPPVWLGFPGHSGRFPTEHPPWPVLAPSLPPLLFSRVHPTCQFSRDSPGLTDAIPVSGLIPVYPASP
uniref:Uncharacterized protein n=1 Tax=Podarcis muralis TaxID=64176 RepID=A0A670J3S5_PODMU